VHTLQEGCGWMEKILKRIDEGDATIKDIDLLLSVANNLKEEQYVLWETLQYGPSGDLSQSSGMNLRRKSSLKEPSYPETSFMVEGILLLHLLNLLRHSFAGFRHRHDDILFANDLVIFMSFACNKDNISCN